MALIKPDAFHRRIEIEEIILNEGFRLVDKKRLRFTRELAEEFYREIKDEETFSALVTLLSLLPTSQSFPASSPRSPGGAHDERRLHGAGARQAGRHPALENSHRAHKVALHYKGPT